MARLPTRARTKNQEFKFSSSLKQSVLLSRSMFKEFLAKQMLERQLKSLPPEERTKIIGTISKNPEFFANLAKELETQIKSGKNQTDAAMAVAKKYEQDLKKLLINEKK